LNCELTPDFSFSNTYFIHVGETVTHCRIVLNNGFSVSGESACVNPENYNQQIGEKIVDDNAFRGWPGRGTRPDRAATRGSRSDIVSGKSPG